MESSFGEKLKVTISGGSHEPSVNVSITGLPQDFTPDMETLQAFLDRRAPGKSNLASPRKEADVPVLKYDSGAEGSATSDFRDHSRRMDFEIANTDHRSADYDKFKHIPRPGHADYTAQLRYGNSLNMAGGGPFSGRMTVGLCVAGGLALQVLAERGVSVSAKLVSAGGNVDTEKAITSARDAGDSVGGIVQCIAEGVPAGIGDAMYGGIESRLSPVLFGIPAVKGVEFGAGFAAADMKGSENNDPFYCDSSDSCGSSETTSSQIPALKTRTNNCGGILGGITTGMPLTCRVAFKPTPSISIPQESVDLRTGDSIELTVDGRHDPCVAFRAVPVVEAAVSLGLLDAIMATEDARSSCETDDLSHLRKGIDHIDSHLLVLFKKRMRLAAEIGKIKKANNLPVLNPSREEEIINRIKTESGTDFAPYTEKLFRNIFSLSKDIQKGNSSDGTFGLIGHPLGHSFSPQVHEAFGAYNFELFDLTPDEMKAFVSGRNFKGLTVTKPYKQDVIPLCDRLTNRAKAIGAVNTLYFEGEDLVGHNTDYDGFLYTADRSGIDFAGKTVLILGTGGTSKTVNYSVKDRGASCVCFASRTGGGRGSSVCDGDVFSYETLNLIADQIDIIVNTTPVGMYPDNLVGLISLKDFQKCQAVIDVVYNPTMTPLLMEADALGLKWANGMPMIVAQAAAAADRFMGHAAEELVAGNTFMNKIEDVLEKIESEAKNIVLIGMPGCGKSTLGRKLAKLTGRDFVDLDEEIVAADGRTIPEIFAADGEQVFRKLESTAAEKFGAEHGQIIATGGGIVLNERNYFALKQNGVIIWLTRPIDELPLEGRPLSENREAVRKLYDERCELYKKWADYIIDNAVKCLGKCPEK